MELETVLPPNDEKLATKRTSHFRNEIETLMIYVLSITAIYVLSITAFYVFSIIYVLLMIVLRCVTA